MRGIRIKVAAVLCAALVMCHVPETAFGYAESTFPSATTGRAEVGVISATSTVEGDRSATPQSAKVVTCTGGYDYPHRSRSSNYKRINAHLSVSCKGIDASRTFITVSSRMTTPTRAGVINNNTGWGKVKKGGDLSCVSSRQNYTAAGTVKIYFPAGYYPRTATYDVKSKTHPFKYSSSAKKCVSA